MDFRLWSTIYFILIALLSINLIMTGERPTKTLAWLLVLIFMPIIGPLLYFTFGVNRKQYGFINFQKRRRAKRYLLRADRYLQELLKSGDGEIINTERQLRNVEQINLNSGAFRASKNNDIEMLVDGEATFQAIFQALESAEHFIHIQYYIFEEGELADRFAEMGMETEPTTEDAFRMAHDFTGVFVDTYDSLDDTLPPGWRENGPDLDLTAFIDPYVFKPMMDMDFEEKWADE